MNSFVSLQPKWAYSNTKQDKFKLDTIERTNKFLTEIFAPTIKTSLSDEMGSEVSMYTGTEEETIMFAYPRLFSSSANFGIAI